MRDASSTACQLATKESPARTTRDRLRRLLDDHHAFVWRTLRRLGVPSGDVEDASQQVFLVAHRRLTDILPESERSFLFQTALRVAADWRRSQRRRNEEAALALPDLPDAAATPEEVVDRQRQRALLDQVLGSLPLKLRAVFVLFELEEMTLAEIATMSDTPLGTVASRLRRARQAFSKAVRRSTIGPRARRNDQGRP
jgi:RNA polymerase sigma-70 factor, ECF subfamily